MKNATTDGYPYRKFREYLNGLPEWDRVTRIDTVLESCFRVNPVHCRPRGKARWISQWIFGHVAYLAMNPDACTTFTEIPLLVGPSECGKSQFLRNLLPPKKELGYAQGAAYVGWGDNIRSVLGETFDAILCEINGIDLAIPEFGKFLFQRSYMYAPPFDDSREERPMRTVFVAMSNVAEESSRRFMALEVDRAHSEPPWVFLSECRDLLWAEAIWRFSNQANLPRCQLGG